MFEAADNRKSVIADSVAGPFFDASSAKSHNESVKNAAQSVCGRGHHQTVLQSNARGPLWRWPWKLRKAWVVFSPFRVQEREDLTFERIGTSDIDEVSEAVHLHFVIAEEH